MVAIADMKGLVPAAFGLLVLMQIIPAFILVSPYLQMLVSASACVFIGCCRSAAQLEVEDKSQVEKMTSKDAMMFPLVGSGVLVGLYVLIKVLHKDYLNLLLGLYFFGIGIVVTAQVLAPIFQPLLPASMSNHTPYKIDFQIPGTTSDDYKVEAELTQVDVACGGAGVVFGAVYLYTKHWVLNNIFGIMFSIQGIEFISLGNVKIGVILLIGLFFYDIFWVFGTDVMVTVATGFKGPIKLQFPKNLHLPEVMSGEEEAKYSIVGLGDIVIPGIYVALMLRYDVVKDAAKMVYFPLCFAGYVGGLVATIIVMHVFEAAQPALLYLVPCCLGFTLVPAMMRGEFTALLAYSEEDEEKADEGDDKKAEDKKAD